MLFLLFFLLLLAYTFLCVTYAQLFGWWASQKRIEFTGSLYVTLRPIPLAQSQANVKPSLRSLLPFQQEQSSLLLSHAIKEVKYADEVTANGGSPSRSAALQLPLWSRLAGQSCKVPKNRWQEFSAGKLLLLLLYNLVQYAFYLRLFGCPLLASFNEHHSVSLPFSAIYANCCETNTNKGYKVLF